MISIHSSAPVVSSLHMSRRLSALTTAGSSENQQTMEGHLSNKTLAKTNQITILGCVAGPSYPVSSTCSIIRAWATRLAI